MKIDMDTVFDRLSDLESHFLFRYKGKNCGVDPISRDKYNLWFGENCQSVGSVSEVFTLQFWNGKNLAEIFRDIEIETY